MQVATRFTVSRECGLPEDVKQRYFEASEEQIEVNQILAHRDAQSMGDTDPVT